MHLGRPTFSWYFYIYGSYSSGQDTITAIFIPKANDLWWSGPIGSGDDAIKIILDVLREGRPWAFLDASGCPKVLNPGLPGFSQWGVEEPLILDDKYIIQDIYPKSFIHPDFVPLAPTMFIHFGFSLTFKRADKILNNPPLEISDREISEIQIENQSYFLIQPSIDAYTGLSDKQRVCARDADLCSVGDPPSYPYRGVVWVLPFLIFVLGQQTQISSHKPEWGEFSFLWLQPNTLSSEMWKKAFFTEFYLQVGGEGVNEWPEDTPLYYILGASQEDKHLNREAYTEIYHDGFSPAKQDGDCGVFDRFYWLWNKGAGGPNYFSNVFACGGSNPYNHPEDWRAYLSGKWALASENSPGLSTIIRKKWAPSGMVPIFTAIAALIRLFFQPDDD